MRYEEVFIAMKERVLADLAGTIENTVFDKLSLALAYIDTSSNKGNDHYRAKASKIPAYYNPNSHTIHLNIDILETATPELIENIYYHELVHAASNHTRILINNQKVLKSGLKIQSWDRKGRQITLHRGLNEGLTQYFANMHTNGARAYRNEVDIISALARRIGLTDLKSAYFSPSIEKLKKRIDIKFGPQSLHKLSRFVDTKCYQEALAMLER